MQSFVGGGGRASALLFVRAEADVPMAVRTLSQLLSWSNESPPATREFLGIVVRRSVDADVYRILGDDGFAPASDVALRGSVGISGLWSLCWFELGPTHDAATRAERRERLLSLLADRPDDEPSPAPRFIPVQDWSQDPQQAPADRPLPRPSTG